MKPVIPAALLALSTLGLSAGIAGAAPAQAPTHAILHVGSAVKSKAAFRHVMGSVKLRYTKHDVFVTITADNLPSASSLGKHAYVVYVSDGAMTDRLGVLKAHGAMSGITGQVMMTKVTDVYVYAESNGANKRHHGIEVLGAMV